MNKGFINKFWSQKMVDELAQLYPNMRNADIAKMLNKSEGSIIGKAFNLKLRKNPAFILECAKAGQFKKGQEPQNKGKKQSEFMSAEAIERTKASRFQKGGTPHNTKHDGYERITVDGYKEVRVSKGKFVQKHRMEWERVNGKIPEGMILVCKDGNALNTHPDNWMPITRVEHMGRNSGPLNLTDRTVATYLSTESRKVDHELKAEILKYPDLINAKRTHLKLNRKIKEHGTKQNY